MNNTLILTYHAFKRTGEKNSYHQDPVYTLHEHNFREQLEIIHKLGFSVISLEQLTWHLTYQKPAPPNSVVITIDDGFASDYEVAFPALMEYGYPATFFVTVNRIQDRWGQLREMVNHNYTIGSHTLSHPRLDQLSRYQLRSELKDSRETIEDHIGTKVKFLALPFGLYNRRVIDGAYFDGYKAVVTSWPGRNSLSTDLFRLKRCTIKNQTSSKAFKKLLLGDRMTMAERKLRSFISYHFNRNFNQIQKGVAPGTGNAFDMLQSF